MRIQFTFMDAGWDWVHFVQKAPYNTYKQELSWNPHLNWDSETSPKNTNEQLKTWFKL